MLMFSICIDFKNSYGSSNIFLRRSEQGLLNVVRMVGTRVGTFSVHGNKFTECFQIHET